MKCDVLSLSLPIEPSCAAFSRRSHTVFVASPLTALPTSSRPPLFDEDVDQEPIFSYKGHADHLRLSLDDRILALSTQQLIKFFDVTTGREMRNLPAHYLAIKALCPGPKSCYTWYSGSLDATWSKWDIREYSSKPSDNISGRVCGPIRCLEVSPDEKLVAIGTDSALTLYDTRQRCPLRHFSASTIGLSFNTSEQTIATFGRDRVVRYWCPVDLECLAISDPFDDDIRTIEFADRKRMGDDDFLLVSTDSELRLMTAWEPCETKSSHPLPPGVKVIDVNMNYDSVDVISYGDDATLAHFTFSVQELTLPSASSSTDDGRLSSSSSFTGDDSLVPLAPVPADVDLAMVAPKKAALPQQPAGHPTSQQPQEKRPPRNASRKPPTGPGARNKADGSRPVTPDMPPPQANLPMSRSSSSGSLASATTTMRMPPPSIRNRSGSPSANTTTATAAVRSSAASSSSAPVAPTVPVQRTSRSVTRKNSPAVVTAAPAAAAAPSVPATTTTTAAAATPAAEQLFNDIMSGHRKRMQVLQRQNGALEMGRDLLSQEDGILKAGDMMGHESIVMRSLLAHLNKTQKWDLRTAQRLLPNIKVNLSSACASAECIASLRIITTRLLPMMINSARSKMPNSTGVDVAAEERSKIAERCLKELVEIRSQRQKFVREMRTEQAGQLEQILDMPVFRTL